MKRQEESYIKKAILEYLKLVKKIYCWNNRNVGVFKNGGYIPSGIRGISDILGILPDGKFLAIEVKTEKGKPTEEQLSFLHNIINNNGIGFIARSVKDVEEKLKMCNY